MKNSATKTFTVTDDDGDELQVELPTRFEVCPTCEGHGTHLHPDIAQHAYSAEEFAEEFDDEERGEYFRRGGRYDVTCEECGGQRVVAVVDVDRCTAEQKAFVDLIEAREREIAFCESIERAERAMGA